MQLVRTELCVRPGGNAELETQVTRLGSLGKGHPGYLGHTLLQSLSQPRRYVVNARFESAEAVRAFLKSERYAQYLHGLPTGLAVPQLGEVYDGILEVDADNAQAAAGACEVLVDHALNQPGDGAEFEQSRRELFETRKRHAPGFVSGRLRRSAGTFGKYLAINIWTSSDAARATVPEVAAFFETHPHTRYPSAPPSIEVYHVVHRM